MADLIEVLALAKTYGQHQVLQDISFTVPAGQVVILLGPNGAGKTVLLKLLAGLLLPDGGDVRLNGRHLLAERPQALSQAATFLNGLQPLDEERLAGEDLPFQNVPTGRFLRALGLEAYRDLPVGGLSNGLRQQVTLARTLGNGRPIFLLDEPFRGLDRHAADVIAAWIQYLAHEQGRAVVVTTCDPLLPLELGDRLVLLRRGRIAADVPLDRPSRLDQPAYYRIQVRGYLDTRWSAWFDGLAVTAGEDGTVISGLLPDQPALHSLLTRVRDLGLLLLSVQRFDAGVEDVLGD
jgi:ABC-type multidrug transport system ATPase subunit